MKRMSIIMSCAMAATCMYPATAMQAGETGYNAEFTLLGCNYKNGAEYEEIANVVWEIDGIYRLADESIMATKRMIYTEGPVAGKNFDTKAPIIVNVRDGHTFVMVSYLDETDASPRGTATMAFYECLVPANALVNVANEELTNPALGVRINSVPADKRYNPEYVNVGFTVNGLHTASHKTLKGEPYSIRFKADENWEVGSVTCKGAELTDVDGAYVIDAPAKDFEIAAALKFRHILEFDGTVTGSGETAVGSTGLTLSAESGVLVIGGLSGGERIRTYSSDGSLVGDATVETGRNAARITLPAAVPHIFFVESEGSAHAFRTVLGS